MRRISPAFAAAFVILAMAVLFSSPVIGQQSKGLIPGNTTLTIGLNASYPPFADWSTDKPVGLDVEIAKHLARSVGLDPDKDVTFVKIKPDDAAMAVQKGDIDIAIAALSITPERLRLAAFAGPYVHVTKAALLQRTRIPTVIINEKPSLMPVDSYNDLKKLEPLTIGAKEKTATIRNAKRDFPKSHIIGYPDVAAMEKDFLAGNIDAIVHEDPYVRYFAAKHYKQKRKFVALTKPVSKEGLYVIYRYSDEYCGKFLDGYLKYLHESGIIEKWKRKYFDNTNWAGGEK